MDCRAVGKDLVAHPVRFVLLISSIALLLGVEVWHFRRPLPAQQWIDRNLEEIRVAEPDDFYFAVFGDNRGSYAVFEELLGRIERDSDISFAMANGDMVHDGNVEKYRTFLQQVQTHLHKPLLTAIGNHELKRNGRSLYTEIFGPSYYAFKLGNACCIVLDVSEELPLDLQQKGWIEKELGKGKNCIQRLVFMHVPLYDPRGGNHSHALPKDTADQLARLFTQYKVTHIFASHIHGYFEGRWSGIPYTISGGAGAALHGRDPKHHFFHYLKVHVNAGQLQVEPRSIPFPAYERMGRSAYLSWLYVYPYLRMHGIELLLLLVIAVQGVSLYRLAQRAPIDKK